MEALVPAVRAWVEEPDELRRIAVQKPISEAKLTLIARTRDGTGEYSKLAIPMFPGDGEALALSDRIELLSAMAQPPAILGSQIRPDRYDLRLLLYGDLPPQPFTHITGHEPEAGGHGPWPAA